MVRPAARRQVAEWARTAFQVSERRACSAVGLARSTFRYKSVRPSYEPLRRRLRELAAVRTCAGYRRGEVGIDPLAGFVFWAAPPRRDHASDTLSVARC